MERKEKKGTEEGILVFISYMMCVWGGLSIFLVLKSHPSYLALSFIIQIANKAECQC